MITPDRPQGDGNDASRSEALEELRRYGASLRGSVSPVQAQAAATRALADQPGRGWSRRWVLAAATAGLLAISNVGLAAASDSSLPGDSLYGVKRGYEQVTSLFGASHVSVRIDEASQLILLGRNASAVAVLAEALAELEVAADVTAALEEAEALLVGGEEDSPQVAEAATDLMKATEAIAMYARSGDEDGKQDAIAAVRERAANLAATARGNSPNFGGSPPIGQDGEDGQDGDVGPPFGFPEGPPDHAGPPDDLGGNGNGDGNGGSGQGGPPSGIPGSPDNNTGNSRPLP